MGELKWKEKDRNEGMSEIYLYKGEMVKTNRIGGCDYVE
jgi:hypothetical protein